MTAEHVIPWWASDTFWRKTAIWVTAASSVALILLTFDTVNQITAGGKRVPDYDVINYRIDYVMSDTRKVQEPRIDRSKEEPLFGQKLSVADAQALVDLGKKTVQAKNCMNCHTLLGNGAYYAPDLTKAWLDPAWASREAREALMLAFLQDPPNNARTFGSNRKMPKLGITEAEAKGIIAFLKWMSSIDTNGFPYNFTPMVQE